MKIKKYKHGEGDFWEIMGPMFASEEIYKAQGGYSMFSNPSTTWYLAFDQGQLIGWVATQPKAKRLDIRFQYVSPTGGDVLWHLIERCVKDNKDEVMKTVEFKDRTAPYLLNGFIKRQDRGKKFIVLCREPE